jgi:hypothetical protein
LEVFEFVTLAVWELKFQFDLKLFPKYHHENLSTRKILFSRLRISHGEATFVRFSGVVSSATPAHDPKGAIVFFNLNGVFQFVLVRCFPSRHHFV